MLPLGKRKIFASVTVFEGEVRVHVRKYAPHRITGELCPKKKGIALTSDEWIKLKEYIQSLDAEVARLQGTLSSPSTDTSIRYQPIPSYTDDVLNAINNVGL